MNWMWDEFLYVDLCMWLSWACIQSVIFWSFLYFAWGGVRLWPHWSPICHLSKTFRPDLPLPSVTFSSFPFSFSWYILTLIINTLFDLWKNTQNTWYYLLECTRNSIIGDVGPLQTHCSYLAIYCEVRKSVDQFSLCLNFYSLPWE